MIVIVEGKADKAILAVFSETLGHKLDQKVVNLIPVADKNNVQKDSPILIYTLSNKKCLIIILQLLL